MTNIKLSIFCMTYNHASFIRETLDGFVMQKTNFPSEVVIGDDCSTDGTTEIVKEYAEKYPDIKTSMTMNPELVSLRPNKEAEYPLGFGEPDDVANMIVYLLSDKAKWITGQDYVIDCGVV